ncbi:MAG TPA: hypothetical protein DDZ80_15885 [Cyanobacteria bacterium UBA8803]|nr:hypothetical protein [Cyanobacteria bacterium UBA9273]HBL59896.1 hypothetical protein [Cyanobacteria bacterium UBA8803]
MISEQKDLERSKRLLSLDGGGIRGLIAVEALVALEKILCSPNGKWNCLADYFDFIGGTSTGSILATGLALGMRAEEIKHSSLRGRQFSGGWISDCLWHWLTPIRQ